MLVLIKKPSVTRLSSSVVRAEEEPEPPMERTFTRARRFKNYLMLFVGKGRRPNALRGPGARARARAR